MKLLKEGSLMKLFFLLKISLKLKFWPSFNDFVIIYYVFHFSHLLWQIVPLICDSINNF